MPSLAGTFAGSVAAARAGARIGDHRIVFSCCTVLRGLHALGESTASFMGHTCAGLGQSVAAAGVIGAGQHCPIASQPLTSPALRWRTWVCIALRSQYKGNVAIHRNGSPKSPGVVWLVAGVGGGLPAPAKPLVTARWARMNRRAFRSVGLLGMGTSGKCDMARLEQHQTRIGLACDRKLRHSLMSGVSLFECVKSTATSPQRDVPLACRRNDAPTASIQRSLKQQLTARLEHLC